jgi:esterase/lipase superfamily enzyme/uncharacterized protein YjbI with pentapeptide repeats
MSLEKFSWHRLTAVPGPVLPRRLSHGAAGFLLALALGHGALAFDAQDLERLQATGSCADCDLSKADLAELVRGAVDLRRADLHGAVLAGADLASAKLGEADLSGADLRDAFLEGATLIGADLEGAGLEAAVLREADLTRANLQNADLSGADLYRSSLRAANLAGVRLTEAVLDASDLSGADLEGADLVGASLEDAALERANLEGADLGGAVLARARFDCANLAGARLPEPGSLTDRDYAPPSSGAEPTEHELSEPEDFQIVQVFYGTDRCRVGAPGRPQFSAERADWLTLGTVGVTVPKAHEIGGIEQSWWSRIFGIRFGEDPNEHFTIHEITTADRASFMQEVQETVERARSYQRQLFVFIHGYNTSFEAAAFRTAQIAYDLQFDSAPVMYSWPSRGSVASYEYDQNSAARARGFLKSFLIMLQEESGADAINLIAHSMGNLALMEVLKDIQIGRGVGEKPIFNEIVLAAPDIDRDVFIRLAEQIAGIADGVTLYASANDLAMTASKKWAGSVPRAGDVPTEGPVVLRGIIDTIDASAISTSILSLNHSGYAEDKLLLNDIGLLWRSGAPPFERNPILRPQPADAPQYWQFP